jgi:hypothetical protein
MRCWQEICLTWVVVVVVMVLVILIIIFEFIVKLGTLTSPDLLPSPLWSKIPCFPTVDLQASIWNVRFDVFYIFWQLFFIFLAFDYAVRVSLKGGDWTVCSRPSIKVARLLFSLAFYGIYCRVLIFSFSTAASVSMLCVIADWTCLIAFDWLAVNAVVWIHCVKLVRILSSLTLLIAIYFHTSKFLAYFP